MGIEQHESYEAPKTRGIEAPPITAEQHDREVDELGVTQLAVNDLFDEVEDAEIARMAEMEDTREVASNLSFLGARISSSNFTGVGIALDEVGYGEMKTEERVKLIESIAARSRNKGERVTSDAVYLAAFPKVRELTDDSDTLEEILISLSDEKGKLTEEYVQGLYMIMQAGFKIDEEFVDSFSVEKGTDHDFILNALNTLSEAQEAGVKIEIGDIGTIFAYIQPEWVDTTNPKRATFLEKVTESGRINRLNIRQFGERRLI